MDNKVEQEKFMLISVAGREIMTELFDTPEEAQACMHKEMMEWGKVPERVFDDYDEFDDSYDYGFGEDCGWANDGVNHEDYDWRIIYLDEEIADDKTR